MMGTVFPKCRESRLARAALASLAVALSSCTTGPTARLMVNLDDANAQRLAKYGTVTYLETAIDSATTPESRNLLLNDLVLLVDLNYYHWEKLLYNKKAGFDLGTDAVVLGLGGATALSGTTSAANILGQITTGITGFKTAVDSDILQKNSVPALVAKMRAARSTQLAKMQTAMTKDVDKYPIQQGLIDLNTYYVAGTFVGALQDITEKAAAEKQEADSKIDLLKGIPKTLIKKAPKENNQSVNSTTTPPQVVLPEKDKNDGN